MDKRMRQESVTLYTHLGENDDGIPAYLVTRVDGACVFRKRGVKAGADGVPQADDTAVVYIFPRASRMRGEYVDAEVFDAMGLREGCWTIHPDGRDRIYLGLSWSVLPPLGSGTVRPVSVAYLDKGRPGLRHVKVVCR